MSVFENNEATKGSAYWGNTTLIDNNYWGDSFSSSKELAESGIININGTEMAPLSWFDSKEEMTNGTVSDVNFTNETENITEGNISDVNVENSTDNNTDDPVAESKIGTKITINAKTFTVTKTKKLTAVLSDVNGNPIANAFVTFIVNSKEYYGKTDSKGAATVTVKLTKAKSFKYNVIFDEVNDYASASASSTVKVVKEKSVMKVTKTSFKAKAKTKKVKVTIKSASKKVIKKVKVTIKIKGKTYKAVTNSKGVASVKIKVTKKGTYKSVVKFAGNANYKAVSKTVKIKIR